MFCPKCGEENPDKNIFCGKCGTKILNEEINDTKIDNKQEEVKLNENIKEKKTNIISIIKKAIFFKSKKRTIIIPFLIIGIIVVIIGGYIGYTSYQDFKLLQHQQLEKQINSKENEFNSYYKTYGKQIEDINNVEDFSDNVISDFKKLLDKYPNEEKTKQLASKVTNKIKTYLNTEKKYNYKFNKLLCYISIAYPEEQKDLESLYVMNEAYHVNEAPEEMEGKFISFSYEIDNIKYGYESTNDAATNNAIPKNPSIGMTTDEIEESNWGKPSHINRTTTANGTSEQWVYPNNKYIYLENGVVTSIQQ